MMKAEMIQEITNKPSLPSQRQGGEIVQLKTKGNGKETTPKPQSQFICCSDAPQKTISFQIQQRCKLSSI
jgi:hypothetical protein